MSVSLVGIKNIIKPGRYLVNVLLAWLALKGGNEEYLEGTGMWEKFSENKSSQ